MRVSRLFHAVRPFITAIAIICVALVLVFAVYFTRLTIPWVAFLTGVLVASVLAEATRLTRAEWLLARRTRQLAAMKEKLERETRLRSSAEDAFAAGRSRLQLFDEVLPTMVALVDTEGRCRYHNRAFREWLRLRPDQADGRLLSEILGAKIYQEIASYVRQALDGHLVKYERTQMMPNGAVYKLAVEHLPQFGEGGKTTGFFMLSNDVTEPGDALAYATAHIGTATQELYVGSFADQVTGKPGASAEIVAAIEKDEFRLFCQEIVPLAAGGEAAEFREILVRLREEEEGMMPPGAFFPLAEKHGMLSHLDRWVVRQVAERAALRIQRQTWHEGSVYFINLSDASLADRSFPDYLEVILLEYGVPGSALCFEIPTVALNSFSNEIAELAQRLKPHGCRIALSGFGRDKVTFNLIRGFQVAYLKIDGTVILNMLRDDVQLAKATAINRVAKQIGVKTVAECVENDEIVAKLKELGIDYAQGFGVSQPRPLEE